MPALATAAQSLSMPQLKFEDVPSNWPNFGCRRGDRAQATCSFGIYISSHFNASYDYKLKPPTLQLNVGHRGFSFVRWNARLSSAWYEYPSQYNLSHRCCGPPSRRNCFYTTLRNKVRLSKLSQWFIVYIVNWCKQSYSRCYKTCDQNLPWDLQYQSSYRGMNYYSRSCVVTDFFWGTRRPWLQLLHY